VVIPNFLVATEDRECPAKKGQTILIDEINPKVDQQIQPSFEVVLHEPGVVECEPLLPTIHLHGRSCGAHRRYLQAVVRLRFHRQEDPFDGLVW
jgi:hypothetical protein